MDLWSARGIAEIAELRDLARAMQTLSTMEKSAFVSDIEEIRRRARLHIEKGAVTEGYRADRETVLELLNQSLATEIVCVLRYRRHYFMAQGPSSKGIADEFLEHANEEQQHADMIAERIAQLGGQPNFSPEGMLGRSHSEYVEGKTLADMVKEDLIAERIAIESYGDIIRFLGDKDPTSRRMLEEILAKEEEHANDMLDLMGQLDAKHATADAPKPENGTAKKKPS